MTICDYFKSTCNEDDCKRIAWAESRMNNPYLYFGQRGTQIFPRGLARKVDQQRTYATCMINTVEGFDQHNIAVIQSRAKNCAIFFVNFLFDKNFDF